MKSRLRLPGMLVATAVLLNTATFSRQAVAETSKADRSRRPNFIVVYCDNLGYGDIEPFGSTLHRTPNLNRMAKEGRRFTHFCVTAGVCTPSRASIMTGCYAQRIGMHLNPRDGWVLRPVSPYGLHPDEITVAEVLKEQGYATAIVGKWHLGDQPEFLPTRQGFDWFFGVPYSDDMTERVWEQDGSKWPPLPLMENEKVIEAPCDRNGLTKRYTERAMRWIAEHKDEPFFLYFPQAMPGSTSTPFSSEAFKGKSKNGPWGDAIEELDWSMGVMLDQLKELGIAENTLVIWTSDNGAPINRDLNDLSRGSTVEVTPPAKELSESPPSPGNPAKFPPTQLATSCRRRWTCYQHSQNSLAAAHHLIEKSTATTSLHFSSDNPARKLRTTFTTTITRTSCRLSAPDRGRCFCRLNRRSDIRTLRMDRKRSRYCSTWSTTFPAGRTSPPIILKSSHG